MDKTNEVNKMIDKYKVQGNVKTKAISDTHHTFGQLYRQRLTLFCVLCRCFPELSWKSKKHFDEENDPMFEGDFIAGINTPKGIATYHIKLEYWDLFDIKEIERAPKYDGCTPEDVMERILSLSKENK